jgi:GntR family transcriptional regulator
MDPQPTRFTAPIQLQIADDLRIKIETGALRPGDLLPSAHELAQSWGCSPSSGRAAINLLKRQGLAVGSQGNRTIVRVPPRRTVLRQDINQVEKDRVLLDEDTRRQRGAAEDTLQTPLHELNFVVHYTQVQSTEEQAEAFAVPVGSEILRREYETTDKASGLREQWSVSHIPVPLIETNPDLLDATKEPWPGGTQHQLFTVGIEIARMDTEVTAVMPTTVEMQVWGLPDGVPLLSSRRLAIDTRGRTVEISEARYPADRTEMLFSITLKPWGDH